MKCAKREPGRSWEAIDGELTHLGNSSKLHPTERVFIPTIAQRHSRQRCHG